MSKEPMEEYTMKKPVRILVTSQKAAKLFSYDKEEGFKCLQTYSDAPWQNEMEFADRAGRGHTSGSGHMYSVGADAHQKEDMRHHFMHHICERLYKDWEENHFQYLCLFAESKALGDLRKYLPKSLEKLVTYESSSNLASEPDEQIVAHLKKIGVSEMIKTVL